MASSIALPDFFAFRTPLLSFDEWLRWTKVAGRPAPDDPNLEQRLAAARAALRVSLHELVQRPQVREALFLASSRLQESIEAWIRDSEATHEQQIERLLISTVSGLFTAVDDGGPRLLRRWAPWASKPRPSRSPISMGAALSSCQPLRDLPWR